MFQLTCNFHFAPHLNLFTGFQCDKMRLLNRLRCLVPLLFLGIVYLMFLTGSSTPQTECRCFLPCDASKFAGHTSVLYRLDLESDLKSVQRVAVSDLLENGKCIVKVPECTTREKPFNLIINSDDNTVSEILFRDSYPEPYCDAEKTAQERSVIGGVAILAGSFLLLFICLLLFV